MVISRRLDAPGAPRGPRTQPASEVAQSHAVRIACAGPRPVRWGFGQRTDDGAVYTQLIWLADAEQPIDGVHEVRVVEVILDPVDARSATDLEPLRFGVGRPPVARDARPCHGGQLDEPAAVVVADLRDTT